MRNRRGRSSAAIICCVCSWFAWGAASAGTPVSDENERIFEVILNDGTVLNEAIVGYQVTGGWLLPIGELAEALGFGINVSPSLGLAEGFLINEDRRFKIDLGTCTVELSSGVRSFRAPDGSCSGAYTSAQDLLLETALWSEWFPLELSVDPFRSRIIITPKENLPVQSKKLRAERVGNLRSGSGTDPGYPEIKSPEATFSGPFLDQQISIERAGDSQQAFSTIQGDTVVAGEILGWETRAFTSLTKAGFQHGRMNLARKNAQGKLLGAMKATRIELLDVALPALTLISSPHEGRGLVLSNYPLDYVDPFGSRNFQGNALPGWEVELYQNNVLLGRQEIGETGQYDFRDVPLYYGSNQFRIEFIGPQGQTRTEYRNFQINTSHARPNQRNYILALGMRDSAPTYSASLEQSIGNSLSVSGSFAQLELTELQKRDQFAQLGVSGFAENLLLSGTAALSKSGGNALQFKSQFPFRQSALSFRYTRLNDFSSDLFNSHQDLKQTDEALAGLSFVVPLNPGIGTTWELARKGYAESTPSLALRNRISTNIGRTYLNHELTFESHAFSTRPSVSGRLDATQLIGRQQLRLGLDYLAAGMQFADAEIQLRHKQLTASAQLRHYFSGSASELNGSISREFKWATIGARFSIDEAGTYNAGAVVSFSVTRDPLARSWHLHSQPQTEFGAASVQTFLDENRNGIRDEKEAPVPEIRLRLHQRNEIFTTNREGLAFIPRLQPHTPADVSIDPDSLVNPLLRSAMAGGRLFPTTGKATEISWPLVTTGEVDGVVEARNGNEVKLLGGITLHLIDSKGTVIMKTRTDRSGAYFFGEVPPGSYEVTPSFTELSEKKLHSIPLRRKVIIQPEGAILSGTDFLLER